MATTYSRAFIEQALVKAFARGDQSILSVANKLNINHHTLRYWMKKKSMSVSAAASGKEKRPHDWTAEEQLMALQESHGLTGEPLQAWCREHGLFAHHLTSWKAAFCAGGQERTPSDREIKTLKNENLQLKRDLVRKEKALAEAAALLMLQKKFRALWEDEV
jgi:transposase-like protein